MSGDPRTMVKAPDLEYLWVAFTPAELVAIIAAVTDEAKMWNALATRDRPTPAESRKCQARAELMQGLLVKLENAKPKPHVCDVPLEQQLEGLRVFNAAAKKAGFA